MNILDAFVVTFALDSSGFKKGEREVNDATKRLNEGNKKAFGDMENRGKSAADAFKKVRNEVIGLGLAFMGATSITGMISSMMTGAAAADRMGKTLGMTTQQVWAWRMAMKSVGGTVGEGDTALQAIQRARMGWQISGDTGNNTAYWRLGVTATDLMKSDPGAILRKIAGMQGKMDPQIYASLLQQIGLPASTIYFLQQGKDSVDKLLAQFAKDSTGQEKLAKETEQLQASLVKLQTAIMGKLVPVLTRIADLLNRVIPGGSGGGESADSGPKGTEAAPGVLGILGLRGPKGYWSGHATGKAGGTAHGSGTAAGAPKTITSEQAVMGAYFRGKGLSHDQTMGILAGIYGEAGSTNAVNPHSGAFGIGQWLGARKKELFRRYGNHPSLQQQLEFMWWELTGGDHGGKAVLNAGGADATMLAYVAQFMRPQGAHNEHYGDLLRDVRRGRDYISHITNHNTYNIKATDPRGTAHEVSKLHRRHAAAQADRGVAP